MIELLKEKVNKHPGTHQEKYNYLRELLQLLILKKIDESGYFQSIAFVGGTALRILYDLERFSEDLDFSLIQDNDLNFDEFIKKIKHEVEHETIKINVKTKIREAVCSALLKFEGLLFEVGLSNHRDEVIFIKLEVDMHPPKGYDTKLSIVSKEYMIAINHYDLPSLYAGKLHAILQRKYTKGRDYYDYLWYCGRKIQPNFPMLNRALEQTMGKEQHLDANDLQKLLVTRFTTTDYKKVQSDIEPFLHDPNELRFFTKEIFLQTLK